MMERKSGKWLRGVAFGGTTLALLGVAQAQRVPAQRAPTQRVPAQRIPAQRVPAPRIEIPEAGGVQGGERVRLAPGLLINTKVVVKSPSILAARGIESKQKLNQLVTVRGFYYEGSIPMVVDDIERVQCDMMMPAETYVPLAVRVPQLQNGDEVTITGRLVTPAVVGLQLQGENTVLRLETPANQAVKKINPRRVELMKFNPRILSVSKVPQLRMIPRKYAVLIVGGGNAANNHLRYWNDLRTMYNILLGRGYSKSNITVIYADGVARNNSVAVDFSASKANINAVFKTLGDKMTASDELYVMINDHGGGFLTEPVGSYEVGSYGAIVDPTNTVYLGYSESALNMDLNGDGDQKDNVHFHNTVVLWGESMTETEFADALNQVKHAKDMMIQMKQCFSGGFTRALRGEHRVVMSSSSPNQVSWSHPNGSYGAFTYCYFTALLGSTPDGEKINDSDTINADANNDGKISMVEAWNYAIANNPRKDIERGWYADLDKTPGSGQMPTIIQGAYGATVIP